MISSFPLCVSHLHWKWPSLLIRVHVMMNIVMCSRSSCLTKNCLQIRPHQLTFLNRLKGLICHHLRAGSSSSQGCTSALSVTSASSITLSSSNTSESTAGCSLTTAPSVGGLSEQPPCWPVTGLGNAKMLPICALNVGTVFQRHWTNSDTTAQSGAVTTTVGTVERVFKNPAA